MNNSNKKSFSPDLIITNFFKNFLIDLQELKYEELDLFKFNYITKENSFLNKKRKRNKKIIEDSFSPESKNESKNSLENVIKKNTSFNCPMNIKQNKEAKVSNKDRKNISNIKKLIKIKSEIDKSKETDLNTKQLDTFQKFKNEYFNKNENSNKERCNINSNINSTEIDLPIKKIDILKSFNSDANNSTISKTLNTNDQNNNYDNSDFKSILDNNNNNEYNNNKRQIENQNNLNLIEENNNNPLENSNYNTIEHNEKIKENMKMIELNQGIISSNINLDYLKINLFNSIINKIKCIDNFNTNILFNKNYNSISNNLNLFNNNNFNSINTNDSNLPNNFNYLISNNNIDINNPHNDNKDKNLIQRIENKISQSPVSNKNDVSLTQEKKEEFKSMKRFSDEDLIKDLIKCSKPQINTEIGNISKKKGKDNKSNKEKEKIIEIKDQNLKLVIPPFLNKIENESNKNLQIKKHPSQENQTNQFITKSIGINNINNFLNDKTLINDMGKINRENDIFSTFFTKNQSIELNNNNEKCLKSEFKLFDQINPLKINENNLLIPNPIEVKSENKELIKKENIINEINNKNEDSKTNLSLLNVNLNSDYYLENKENENNKTIRLMQILREKRDFNSSKIIEKNKNNNIPNVKGSEYDIKQIFKEDINKNNIKEISCINKKKDNNISEINNEKHSRKEELNEKLKEKPKNILPNLINFEIANPSQSICLGKDTSTSYLSRLISKNSESEKNNLKEKSENKLQNDLSQESKNNILVKNISKNEDYYNNPILDYLNSEDKLKFKTPLNNKNTSDSHLIKSISEKYNLKEISKNSITQQQIKSQIKNKTENYNKNSSGGNNENKITNEKSVSNFSNNNSNKSFIGLDTEIISNKIISNLNYNKSVSKEKKDKANLTYNQNLSTRNSKEDYFSDYFKEENEIQIDKNGIYINKNSINENNNILNNQINESIPEFNSDNFSSYSCY